MGAGCCQIIGLIMLVITDLAIIISFATPYWTEFRANFQRNWGLWARCDNTDCTWMFDNDFNLQQNTQDWFKATQALMSLGLCLGLVALLMATLTLCCTCHKCNPNQPICGILVVAGLVLGIAVTIFGIKANSEWHIELQWKLLTVGKFGWSFWVAVSSSIMSLLTASIYGCIGRSH